MTNTRKQPFSFDHATTFTSKRVSKQRIAASITECINHKLVKINSH